MERRKATILHIIGQLSLGGAEWQLFLLLKELSERYKFIVLSYDPERTDYAGDLLKLGVDVLIISKDPGIRGRLRFLRQLIKIIKGISPDIIQTWMISPNFWGWLACLLTGIKKRAIASVRNVREIDFVVIERIIYWLLSRWSTVIISNTAIAKSLIIRYGVPPAKIRVIPNGIEPTAYDVNVTKEQMKAELGIHSENMIIGTIGRMGIQKNQVMFISMAKELLLKNKALHFVIVGDGELRPQLEQTIKRSGLSSAFILTGSRRDVARVLKAFDVFVLTSSWEGFPNVIMEAMCARLPVVATAVGGVPELIRDGVNGLLVARDDLDGLVRTVELLLMDMEHRKLLGEEGRRSIEEHYTLGRMAEETAEIYDEILNAN